MKITGLDEERHGRRWNGQRALVTGAGQGIGQAVAQLLASKGVKVAVNDIVPERAENTVKLIADAGGEAFAAIGDIADPTVVEDLFRQLDERFGGIDILVNVAGIIIKDSLDDTDLERWNRILAVNLTADFLTIKQAVKRMRKQHYGRIVNVSSIAAKHGRRLLGRRRLRVHQGGRRGAHARSGQGVRAGRHQRERGHAGTHLHAYDRRHA